VLIGGANLDAPLNQQPPTLGSEISRGADAAFDCGLAVEPSDSQGFLNCINGRQSDNRQKMGRGYGAFDAGLWYAARSTLRIIMSVVPSELNQAALSVADAELRAAELAAGVTDDDILRAH
jgi:hypothetical protein